MKEKDRIERLWTEVSGPEAITAKVSADLTEASLDSWMAQ